MRSKQQKESLIKKLRNKGIRELKDKYKEQRETRKNFLRKYKSIRRDSEEDCDKEIDIKHMKKMYKEIMKKVPERKIGNYKKVDMEMHTLKSVLWIYTMPKIVQRKKVKI